MEHIFITIITLAAYFLPALIALVRNHHNKTALMVTNLLLGWTGIVWLVTLIWAFTNQKETSIVINNTQGVAK